MYLISMHKLLLMEIVPPFVPPFVPPLVDHAHYFRHAPARLRVDANMFVLACGYAAICLLGLPWFA